MTTTEPTTTESNAEVTSATDAAAAKVTATTLSKADLTAWLRGEDISEDDNSDEITFDQAVRILSADSPEKVLSDDDVRKSESLVGQTFTILSASWRKSTKSEDGAGRYAFLSCVDAEGVPFYSSCGATKVVLQVRKAELEGWFPWTVTLGAVDTNSGRTMLQLEAPSTDF